MNHARAGDMGMTRRAPCGHKRQPGCTSAPLATCDCNHAHQDLQGTLRAAAGQILESPRKHHAAHALAGDLGHPRDPQSHPVQCPMGMPPTGNEKHRVQCVSCEVRLQGLGMGGWEFLLCRAVNTVLPKLFCPLLAGRSRMPSMRFRRRTTNSRSDRSRIYCGPAMASKLDATQRGRHATMQNGPGDVCGKWWHVWPGTWVC